MTPEREAEARRAAQGRRKGRPSSDRALLLEALDALDRCRAALALAEPTLTSEARRTGRRELQAASRLAREAVASARAHEPRRRMAAVVRLPGARGWVARAARSLVEEAAG